MRKYGSIVAILYAMSITQSESAQLLVGTGTSTTMDLVDVEGTGLNCQPMPNYPHDILGASGGLIDGSPVVCGGLLHGSGSIIGCNSYDGSAWQPAHYSTRLSAAAAQIDASHLWISGGAGQSGVFDTSDILESNSVVSAGPFLPDHRWGHCMVALDGNRIAIVGGSDGDVSLTTAYIYDYTTSTFSVLPDLPVGRSFAMCALSNNGEDLVIAGGREGTHLTDDVQVFSLADLEWRTGTPLPQPLYWGTGVTLTDGRMLVVGGYRTYGTDATDVILGYDSASATWSEFSTKLPRPTAEHVGFMVPDSVAGCE